MRQREACNERDSRACVEECLSVTQKSQNAESEPCLSQYPLIKHSILPASLPGYNCWLSATNAAIEMAVSNGVVFTSEATVAGGDTDREELERQLRLKDDVIENKTDKLVSLGKRVKALEKEVGVLWERLGKMGEDKRELEMKTALVQEEAARSLTSMVAAQRERRREEGRNKEVRQQLELQVAAQAEEMGHLRQQLREEAQAHRDDVEAIQKQLRRLRAQLERAKGLGNMSASQPSIFLHYNTPPSGPPWLARQHQPILHTVSDVPPSYQQSTRETTPILTTPIQTTHTDQVSYQRAPATFHTGVTAFHGHLCYFSSFMTTDIHIYDTAVGAWHILPSCPVTNFGLEVVGQNVTTIGGRLLTEPALCTTQLFSLSAAGRGERGAWLARLPPMKLARAQPATTSNSRLVIVAGGEVGDHKTFIADIEVLVLETGQWSTVASSPLGNYSWLTAVVCQDQLYLLEGNGVREKDNLHALHMGALVEGLRQPVAQQHRGRRGGLRWRQVRPAPASNTTCVCAKGQLVAVGGIDTSGKTTNQIWAFNNGKDQWKTLGSLKSHRYRSLVSVTATGSLLVIGGLTKTNFTDRMEIFDSF
jgi:hypothetical protein